MIIDGTHLILGRLATVAAKKALLGESVSVVNCDKVVISGKREMVLKEYKSHHDRGIPLKGPYFPKMSERIVRRTIRGMLPHRQGKGAEAFKRIMCYRDVPEAIKDQKLETIKEAHVSGLRSLRYVTVKDVAEFLGGR